MNNYNLLIFGLLPVGSWIKFMLFIIDVRVYRLKQDYY